MNKLIKVIGLFLIIIVVSCNIVMAYEIPNGKQPDNGGEMLEIGNRIVTVINVIGVILSVVILMIIGIKYMMGSIEEKATYKKSLLPYLIGAFILFTGSFIPNMIYNFSKSL